jgi:hypothetical protein
MSLRTPFLGRVTGLEKSGAVPAAETVPAADGFGAVEILLITIDDCDCKKSYGQTFFRVQIVHGRFTDDFRFAKAIRKV